jgi:electron transfer flavoprotein alpha subunit
VVVGHGIDAVAQDVAARGVDRVLVADDPALERYTTDAYTQAIEAAVAATQAKTVLLAGTTAGRDLGPYLGARAGVNCLSDCTALRWEGSALIGTRPVFQGKMLTDVTDTGDGTHFAVLRAGVVEPAAAGGATALIEPLEVNIDASRLRVKLVDVTVPPVGGANLEEADVIVVGGRGVGSAEDFAKIEELAAAFGAPVGATRAVTDLGWRPHFEQIGQTGKTVRPKLYIGVGVSGAVQHTVGMQGSETIVAINRDPQAPIFKFAEIGVIGDLNEIVPALTTAVRSARGK